MLRKSLSLVLLMLFIGTLVSLGAQELAQGAASPLTTAGNDIALGPHTLYATYAKYSNTPVIVGAGYQPVDNGTMFTCPGSSCLVEFDEFVQISSPKPGDGTWSICAAVDGNLVNTPNCPSQGQPNVYGTYTVGSFIQFATVSSGMHTLQTFVYSPDGLTKDIWSLAYRVYYP